MRELSKEELWDECALAFNMALEKASRAYHWRYERIHQAKKQIRQLIENQPGVDEEFIEKWIDKLGVKVRQRWNDDYYVNPSKEDLKQMLKEAGIRIKGEE